MTLKSSLVTRRQFLTWAGATSAVSMVGAGWTASLYQMPMTKDLVVTSYDLKTEKWPTHRAPLKVAFVTDFHVGCSSVTLDVLERIVTQTNDLHADLILLGGDFQTRPVKKFGADYVAPMPIAQRLGQLKAPLGVYAVMGNHDWHTDGVAMWDAIAAQGIRMLENEAVRIDGRNGLQTDGLWIVGLADFSTRTPDYSKAIAKIDDDAPRIILSHDPYTFADIDDAGVIQLSGHTHGGQVTLPFIGPVVKATPQAPIEWSYGLITHENRQMIVSSGIGTSILPFKNTPNEIVLLTISAADD